MKLKPIILGIFLFLTVPKTQSDSTYKEDLQDEYYTIAITNTTKTPQPSDERDAQAVLDNNKDESVMASIFVYRDKIRRSSISNLIWTKNDKIVDSLPGLYDRRRRREWWIDEWYLPSKTGGVTFTDLLFSLIFDENMVIAGFLNNFFEDKLEKWITIAMVLTKDMEKMISAFDKNMYMYNSFKKSRKRQRDKFEHMLRVWVRHNRNQLEKQDPSADVVKQNVDALKQEQDVYGSWGDTRDQLELVTMKQSIKLARLVIQGFEKLNNYGTLEGILANSIKTCELDENLADTYASLALYIKDKHKYIAQILGPHKDGSDPLPAWILCIAVVHPQEWPEIDKAFKEDQKGVSLSKFITETVTYDKVLAETLAAIVDPNFKPTLFKERPLDNSPLPPTAKA